MSDTKKPFENNKRVRAPKRGRAFESEEPVFAPEQGLTPEPEPPEPPSSPDFVPNRRKLRLGVKDVVRGRSEPEEAPGSVTVLYEDNHLLVALKPQNVPTQADESGDPDMLTLLKKYLVDKYDKPGDAYLGLVHRLDRPTGGVMVFAKTSKAAARLCEQIRDPDGDFQKSYLAVVAGRPTRTGVLENYLAKDEKTNTVTVVPSSLEGAKKAVAEVRLIEEGKGMSLVGVELVTGRSHQARVQLKYIGTPIVGDVRYAGSKLIRSPHLALWAYRLAFTHPTTGDRMVFMAPPPEEFPWKNFDIDALIDSLKPQG